MSAITDTTQALLTGHIAGDLMMEAGKFKNNQPCLAVTNVDVEVDDDGNYTNRLFVTFKSGTLLCVTVNEVTEITEE